MGKKKNLKGIQLAFLLGKNIILAMRGCHRDHEFGREVIVMRGPQKNNGFGKAVIDNLYTLPTLPYCRLPLRGIDNPYMPWTARG